MPGFVQISKKGTTVIADRLSGTVDLRSYGYSPKMVILWANQFCFYTPSGGFQMADFAACIAEEALAGHHLSGQGSALPPSKKSFTGRIVIYMSRIG